MLMGVDSATHSKLRAPARNRFHALCPYFAMFPEAFVEHWVDALTQPGDLVLDPFSGRGTTVFQSLLKDRQAVACDVNPVAVCVSRAKADPPELAAIRGRITALENAFDPTATLDQEAEPLPEFFRHAFSPSTLRQLLYLRSRLSWETSRVDGMIAALVLGSLHGESEKSPSYLSTQMPRTISTKPAYSVRFWAKHGFTAPDRDTFTLLRQRAGFRYESERPERRGTVYRSDMRELPRLIERGSVGCVITSPPYFDVTNFEEDQWLRLWFLGGPSRPTFGRLSKDDRHENRDRYWGLIADLWRTLGRVCAENADVVIRIGAKGISNASLASGLSAAAVCSGRSVELVSQSESDLRRRQTDSFRPGSKGVLSEIDCHLRFR